MASESSPAGQLTASRLLTSLKIQPFCDDIGDQDLTPEQQAAVHAFLHEVLAAYYRMTEMVPVQKAATILDRRFAQAASGKPRR